MTYAPPLHTGPASDLSFGQEEGVVWVIGKDGSTRGEHDPRLDSALALSIYKAMMRTRLIDQQLERLQRQGRIGFHVGALGEEAAIVASAAALRPQDWIFPCYREIGALLWRDFPLRTYVDNMFGNAEDVVRGRQMPDHYVSRKLHYASVSSPIGTQITHAVGMGWAARLQKEACAAATYFGDGATSSNDFHAGLNFAGVFKAPVLFLCRNNRWAISIPVEHQSASATIADKGRAYGVTSVRCDGNDALAVYSVTKAALERALQGDGPTLIELLTYRLGGHSTSDDPKIYRSVDELAKHQAGDPLLRMRSYLERRGLWSNKEEEEYQREVEEELRACVRAAEEVEKPSLQDLTTDVYEERPWHLDLQTEELEMGQRPRDPHR